MAERAQAVVIGGGITGASVAYHLAKAGLKDTLLLDKGELTSGSTCHAAGLVTQFNPSPTMMRFRRYSIELYRELGVFETVGSLRFASSKEQLMELQRGVSRARGIGLDVELVSADEAARLMPVITRDSLHGAVWVPGDGHLDPHTATHALAKAAREMGARVMTDTRVTGLERSELGAVQAVMTQSGRIETEVVVVAGGLWGPQIAAMAGAVIVSTPVDHQHAALRAVPGHEVPHDMPCFRDPDNLVYGKAEAGGVVLGGYEGDPVARWLDGAPWDHSGVSLPPDQHRFEPLLHGAARRFPFLGEAGIVKLVCHPDAMTPDANPLVGPMPGVPGLYIAAGLSLNGFGGAGGIGRALAELITGGEAELDLYSYRPWRFGPVHRDARYAAELARESYRYYYLLRYPFDADEWGRPKRTSALHTRMQDLGAVFGAKHGWERPEHFEPDHQWRRAGADQRDFGWTRPPWFDRLAEEHRAFRERAGIIDMSSFGKIELQGPGALPLLERAAGNLIDRPVGSVVYTQLLEKDGGVAADVTVTRLGEERFRVITGAGYVNSDMGWLRMQRHANDPAVAIREVTEELAVIGMWGPHARAILEKVTRDDVSEEGFPFMQDVCRRAGLGAVRRPGLGRSGVGPADGRRQGVRDHPRRLPGARLAANGDGLPLLRDRYGPAGQPIRGGPGLLRAPREVAVHQSQHHAAAAHPRNRRRGLPDGLRRRGCPLKWQRGRSRAQLRVRFHGAAQPRLLLPSGRAQARRHSRGRGVRQPGAGHRHVRRGAVEEECCQRELRTRPAAWRCGAAGRSRSLRCRAD